MSTISNLLQGIVVETTTKSLTGPFFYSDKTYVGEYEARLGNWDSVDQVPFYWRFQSPLNELSRIPVIGIAAGITRMALAVIHTIGHLFAALLTWNKGHCYHTAKGCCEFLRGFIESLPIAGRLFAQHYFNHGDWWIIKIYNPKDPDALDRHKEYWNNFRQVRPTAYITA